ncbi:hypothetical protein [Halolamina sediminis]|uniref:hypothetical protein n=1 Tax=Halolamina sediminis TaxID=1480675 RepID=UPI0012AC49FE|nr:hypothetical protein [Halolamina sediminis]
MAAKSDDEWCSVDSLPARPLLVAELPEVASAFNGDTAMWVEINTVETKREFGLPDHGEELVINFVVLTDDDAYQFRFDEDHWVMAGPIQSASSLSTVGSASDRKWIGFDHLQELVRSATAVDETIPVETEEYRSTSRGDRTELLPAHFATLGDLVRLKTCAKQAYGGAVTVWAETGLLQFYKAHADIADLGAARVRCIAVETEDAYYRFEFDVVEQTWRVLGPIDPAEWAYEPPRGSEFVAVEELGVDDADNMYWWPTSLPAPEVTVSIADLNPYSTLHMCPQEKRSILEALDERLDDLGDNHSEDDPRYESVADLRATVQQASLTLRLSVEEHDRLVRELRWSSAEASLRRLRNAEPECTVGCAESGYQRIQIDDGDVYTVCNDCKAAIVGPGDSVPVLRQLDPRITAEHDVTIEWPETEQLDPTQQAGLDDFC